MIGLYFYVKVKKEEPFIQDIQKLLECVKGDQIRFKNGLIYCYGISSVLVYPFEKKYTSKFVIGSI